MRPTSFRLGALLAAGVLGVHEFRYRGMDEAAASSAGHGYLGVLTALVGVALTLALGRHLHLWVVRRADGRPLDQRPVRLWLFAAGCVLAGYAGQELLAGWLSTGHPVGVEGMLNDGGWVALPLAAAFGGAVALATRCAAVVLARRARRGTERRRPIETSCARLVEVLLDAGCVVADHLAGRSPPPALSH